MVFKCQDSLQRGGWREDGVGGDKTSSLDTFGAAMIPIGVSIGASIGVTVPVVILEGWQNVLQKNKPVNI